MANEITATCNLKVVNASLSISKELGAQTLDMTGDAYTAIAQDIGTSHETITVPAEVATIGWCWFRNNDGTNFVEVGLDVAAAFVPFLKLKPGEYCVCPCSPAITLYAQADTATVILESVVVEV